MQSLAEAGGSTRSSRSVPLFNDEVASMDATRARRTKDRARRQWYARHRQRRFARFLGFATKDPGRDR
ncbi:MAG TPA: hypothetical protein VKP69_09010, partial [Isosphaeraceae bacterium]|nr:hypothetical protein [Isosphaeraceae bacterium]